MRGYEAGRAMGKRVHNYEGESIRVTWDARRCIHAAECVRRLPAVFDTKKRPWVDPGAADADAVAGVIHHCPTGALQFERLDGGAVEPTPPVNTIEVDADGPLYVRGDVRLVTPEGEEVLRDRRVALCRCGLSRHKPFCDDSHQQVGFESRGLAEAGLRVDEEVATDGGIEIVLSENGPYVLRGPVEVRDPHGGERRRGTRCALCRCGESARKPWCDGTHKHNGFRSG